jgi:hypothetical protein
MRWAKQASAGEDHITKARRLAAEIADAADADQWSISIDGVDVIGPAELDEVVPRRLLQLLNGGHPATYRLTIPLGVPGRDLGTVRLGTIRPGGFRPTNIAKAYEAARRAAIVIEATEAVRNPADHHPDRRKASRKRGQRANLRLCQPWQPSWNPFPPDAC